jgi:hypothetical protein
VLAELEGAGNSLMTIWADYVPIQSSFRDATPQHMGSQYVWFSPFCEIKKGEKEVSIDIRGRRVRVRIRTVVRRCV